MAFKKILAAVDFSAASREAMQVAAGMAIESGAELVLVSVWQPPLLALAGEGPESGDMIQTLETNAERQLAGCQTEAAALGVKKLSTKFEVGVAWDRIVSLLQADTAFDLVVMGTHGRTGLRHALLGSVAENVVRHAPCAVLVVRSRVAT